MAAWDIDGGLYTGKSLLVSAQGEPFGLYMTASYIFTAAANDDAIFRYDTSSPFDLGGTITYDQTLDISAVSPTCLDLALSGDGLRLYLLESNGTISKYTLSSNYDLTTATYDGDAARFVPPFSYSTASGLFLKDDGTKFWIARNASIDTIYEYEMSSAYDLTTATLSGTLNISSEITSPSNLRFKSDGSKMYVNSLEDIVYQYTLTTDWDVTSAVYDNVTLDTSSETSSGRGLFISPDGEKLFSSDTTTERIYQYDIISAKPRAVDVANGGESLVAFNASLNSVITEPSGGSGVS